MEMQMSELAPWDAVRQIYTELATFVKKDLFEMHRNDFTNHFQRVDDRLSQTFYKSETTSEIERMAEALRNDIQNSYLTLKEY